MTPLLRHPIQHPIRHPIRHPSPPSSAQAASSLLKLGQEPLLSPALSTAAAVRQGLTELAAARAEAAAEAAAEEEAAAAEAAASVATGGSAASASSFSAAPSDAIAVSAALLPVLEQIKPILEEIDYGATEFEPPPAELRVGLSQLYEASRTLIVKFEDDAIDESEELQAAIDGCTGVELRRMRGTHVTPLTPAAPGLLPSELEGVLGGASQREFEEVTALCLDFISQEMTKLELAGVEEGNADGEGDSNTTSLQTVSEAADSDA